MAKLFDESVEAQNEKRYGVLSDMRPGDLYDEEGKPQDEDAEATI